MDIVIITQFLPLPDQAGAARVTEMAALWAEKGHRVVIITSDLDQHTGRRIPRRKRRGEKHGSVRVRRLWSPAIRSRSSTARILRDGLFAFRASFARLPVRRPSIVIGSSPPLLACIASVVLAKRGNAPCAIEVRDLWPDVALELGKLRGRAGGMALRLEKWLYRKSELVVTVTPGFHQRLLAKGVPPERLAVVANGVKPEEWQVAKSRTLLRSELGWSEDEFIAVYAGAHGEAQDLEQLLAAWRQGAPGRLVLIGDGAEKPGLIETSHAWGLERVDFLDPMPRSRLKEALHAADCAFVCLRDVAIFADTYPAKTFEIMASGTPLVSVARGDLARLVEESGAGLAVEPGQPEKLAKALQQIADDRHLSQALAEAGPVFVRKEHDRRKLAENYLHIMGMLQPTSELEAS